MQYIPKYIINHYFPEVAEFLKNDKSETPEDYFHSPSRNIEVERKIIDPKEASLFFKQLTPENWIYINWISELPELEKFLLGSLPEISFSDNLKWQEHALFNSFQSFISPFLEKIILANNWQPFSEDQQAGFEAAVVGTGDAPSEWQEWLHQHYADYLRQEIIRRNHLYDAVKIPDSKTRKRLPEFIAGTSDLLA